MRNRSKGKRRQNARARSESRENEYSPAKLTIVLPPSVVNAGQTAAATDPHPQTITPQVEGPRTTEDNDGGVSTVPLPALAGQTQGDPVSPILGLLQRRSSPVTPGRTFAQVLRSPPPPPPASLSAPQPSPKEPVDVRDRSATEPPAIGQGPSELQNGGGVSTPATLGGTDPEGLAVAVRPSPPRLERQCLEYIPPLWAPEPDSRPPTPATPPGAETIDIERDWILPLRELEAQDQTQGAVKRPWTGSPNLEEQRRRSLGQRRVPQLSWLGPYPGQVLQSEGTQASGSGQASSAATITSTLAVVRTPDPSLNSPAPPCTLQSPILLREPPLPTPFIDPHPIEPALANTVIDQDDMDVDPPVFDPPPPILRGPSGDEVSYRMPADENKENQQQVATADRDTACGSGERERQAASTALQASHTGARNGNAPVTSQRQGRERTPLPYRMTASGMFDSQFRRNPPARPLATVPEDNTPTHGRANRLPPQAPPYPEAVNHQPQHQMPPLLHPEPRQPLQALPVAPPPLGGPLVPHAPPVPPPPQAMLPADDPIPLVIQDATADGPRAPMPPGGFPVVHRQDAFDLADGMPAAWVRRVSNAPPNTLMLAQVWNYRYTTDFALNRRTAHDLEVTLRRALNIPETQAIYVIPPEHDPDDPRGAQARPTVFTIHGLLPHQIVEGVARRVYSYPNMSFFTYSSQLVFGTWLFSLERFAHGDRREIYSTVCRVFEEESVRNQIAEMVRDNPRFAGMTTENAVRYVLNTLDVRVFTMNNGNIVANVYMTSPTNDLVRWRAMVAGLRTRHYESPTNTTAVARHVTWLDLQDLERRREMDE
uniref:Cell surface hydrophobicity-associated protein n=1 Tax=Ganoderma boninense TaxID=34458 RepID=A0A5K1K5U3_9APHY